MENDKVREENFERAKRFRKYVQEQTKKSEGLLENYEELMKGEGALRRQRRPEVQSNKDFALICMNLMKRMELELVETGSYSTEGIEECAVEFGFNVADVAYMVGLLEGLGVKKIMDKLIKLVCRISELEKKNVNIVASSISERGLKGNLEQFWLGLNKADVELRPDGAVVKGGNVTYLKWRVSGEKWQAYYEEEVK